MRRFAVAAAAFAAACRLLAQEASGAELLAALNLERERMDLEPLTLSPTLARLAQARAEEITAGEALDFEPPTAIEPFGDHGHRICAFAEQRAVEAKERWHALAKMTI